MASFYLNSNYNISLSKQLNTAHVFVLDDPAYLFFHYLFGIGHFQELYDTERFVAHDSEITHDLLRKLIATQDYIADTMRLIGVAQEYEVDTIRTLIGLQGFSADTFRTLASEEEYEADTFRVTISEEEYEADTLRDRRYFFDAFREIIGEITSAHDTRRQIAMQQRYKDNNLIGGRRRVVIDSNRKENQ